MTILGKGFPGKIVQCQSLRIVYGIEKCEFKLAKSKFTMRISVNIVYVIYITIINAETRPKLNAMCDSLVIKIFG